MTNYALIVDSMNDASEVQELEGISYDFLKGWGLTFHDSDWYVDESVKTGGFKLSLGANIFIDEIGDTRNVLAVWKADWIDFIELAPRGIIQVGTPLYMSHGAKEDDVIWPWNHGPTFRTPTGVIRIPDNDSALVDPLMIAPSHMAAIDRYVETNLANIQDSFVLKHQILLLMDLVNRYGHQPVLVFEEDEGSLELEVRVNPDELLMISILSNGTIDGTIHRATSGYHSMPEARMSDLLNSLHEPNRVMLATIK